jgi:glycosyltransferase involved in cell wall biosynthesis
MQIISTSRYLVQPSIYEGFSIPPLEALACGTQPIISDIPVHHEIFDGAPVRYFNPKDAVALAKEIINNPDPILPIAYSTFVSNKGYCYSNTAKLILNKIISHIEKC